MLSYLIFGITYAFAAAVQPGPLQTYILSQTLKRGWRSTLPVSLAPMVSDGPIIILVLFMLSTMPDNFIVLLRTAGGLFLLYLGFRAYKSWQEFDTGENISRKSNQQTLLSAVFVNLLNPAPYLGWSLILGPNLLEGWRIEPAYGIALLLGFYITMTMTLAGTIFLFGFARRLGPKVSKILLGFSSVVLGIFGIYQLYLVVVFYAQS